MSTRTVMVPYQGYRTTQYGHSPKVSGEILTDLISGGRAHYDELVTDIRDIPARNAAKHLRKKGFRPVRSEKGTYELCHVSPRTIYQRVTFKNGIVTLSAEAHPTGASTLSQEIRKGSDGVIRNKIVYERPNR